MYAQINKRMENEIAMPPTSFSGGHINNKKKIKKRGKVYISP